MLIDHQLDHHLTTKIPILFVCSPDIVLVELCFVRLGMIMNFVKRSLCSARHPKRTAKPRLVLHTKFGPRVHRLFSWYLHRCLWEQRRARHSWADHGEPSCWGCWGSAGFDPGRTCPIVCNAPPSPPEGRRESAARTQSEREALEPAYLSLTCQTSRQKQAISEWYLGYTVCSVCLKLPPLILLPNDSSPP